MTLTPTHRHELKIIVFFALFSFILLLFMSPDSYLHDLYGRCDSAWFFTAGKAWMSGLTPYVDYTDSKGPLLWLIYGVGYLIDHDSYVGVYWLSVVAYTINFYCYYRAARIFTRRDTAAIMASLFMTWVIFLNPFHREVRAEDFAQPLMAASLWAVCRVCWGGDVAPRLARRAAALLGVCTGALLFIKYNFAAMQGVMAIVVAWQVAKRRLGFGSALLCYVAGFAAVTMPFVVTFAFMGNLGAFINEYFFTTMHVVTTSNGYASRVGVIRKIVFNMYFNLCELLFLVSAVLAVRRVRWLPVLMAVWYLGIFFIGGYIAYHYRILAILFFPLMVALGTVAARRVKLRPVAACALVACVVIATDYGMNYRKMNRSIVWDNDDALEQEYYTAAHLMAQVEHPTMVYLHFGDYGYGLFSDAMPGTKYWAYQVGGEDEMFDTQLAALRTDRPDFAFVWDDPKHPEIHKKAAKALTAAGYRCYKLPRAHDWDIEAWSWHDLQPAPARFHIPWQDVVLKRAPSPQR